MENERYPDFACSHEPYYYLDLHELNFPDRDERGCGLVNMTVHVMGGAIGREELIKRRRERVRE